MVQRLLGQLETYRTELERI